MKPKQLIPAPLFVGRKKELQELESLDSSEKSALLIVYGRRRVGKTELIEHAFCKRNVLKFEGIEGYPQEQQRKLVLQQLAEYAEEPLLREVNVSNWIDVFRHIHRYTEKGTWTIYFEEVQWLSDYKTDFVSELKYAWDNFFRQNPHLILILCGSATSFMIKDVVRSKALYNRSQHEIQVREFSFPEAYQFFEGHSIQDVMDAYLCVGGIPEYLNRLKTNSSIYLSLCDQSFKSTAFFSKEYEKIFISHFATNPAYQQIIAFLSRRKFATRDEILGHLKIKSGGRISELLEDLELCGFIGIYTPFYLTQDSKLSRYCIQDAYLQFYYKFINPLEKDIREGVFDAHPERAISDQVLQKWLGYAFERYCRRHHHDIANALGFSGIRYRSGPHFSRKITESDPGYQMDLVFERDDHVITVCEIKYLRGKVSTQVIEEFERKLRLFPDQNKTIQKVLICTHGVEESLKTKRYFDRILTLEDLIRDAL